MSAIQDKFSKINPKHKLALKVLIPVALVAGFVYFVYLPDGKKISGLESSITQNESEISKSKVMERKLEELKVANAKLQAQLKDATKFLPGAEESANLQDMVSQMAKDTGLTLKDWKAGAASNDSHNLYSQTQIAVQIEGGYHELGQFMEKIDSMERLIVVNNLDMSAAKLEGKKMRIPVKLTLVAYYAAVPPPAGKKPSAGGK